MGEISVKTGNNARNGGKNSLNRLIRCVCGKKIGPDPRNFNQRVSLGRNDLLIRTFLSSTEVPPGAPSGDYLMLETSAYIFAMKQPRGYTYIGLVKNLINEGEGHIWWKI
ncbi:hypothetical protein ACCR89_27565 (plasmid) [Klebsiella pneumoniae]